MLFNYIALGLGLTATYTVSAAVIQDRAACNADLCLRALRASQIPTRLSQASAACRSYLAAAFLPTVSITVTAQSHATTSKVIATTTVYETAPRNNAAGKRDLVERAPTIPAYASLCLGGARFISACSCIGVYPVTPTYTATATDTVSYTSTSTATLAAPTAVYQSSSGDLDEGSLRVDLPFEMEIYGVKSSSVWLSTNGFLSFTHARDFRCWNNLPLPRPELNDDSTTNLPAVAALPYWDDLQIFPSKGEGIWYGVDGVAGSRVATFEWFASPYGNENVGLHFFLRYEEAKPNLMTFHYYRMDQTGGAALVGVQSYPDHFVQYSNDQAGKVPSGTVLKVDTLTNTITPIA